jgi:hypothetical protein
MADKCRIEIFLKLHAVIGLPRTSTGATQNPSARMRGKLVQEHTMRSCKHSRLGACAAMLAIATMLVGCEGTVSVDLGTLPPADPRIESVIVELDGVEFQKSDGGTETFEFDAPQSVDLMDYLDSNDFRILTDEELDDGNYSGVRLLFDPDAEEDENKVILQDNREFPLTLSATNAFSAVNFTVDKDDSSSDAVQLTLDLRQSVQFDDDDDDGTVLTPVIRAIRTEDAGGVAGNVSVACPENSLLAIYLFTGKDVTPDDIDGGGVEPYLTTGVGVRGSSTSSGYQFPFLPAGGYTLASTCRADEDTRGTNDELNFENAANIDVEAEKSLTRNIPN